MKMKTQITMKFMGIAATVILIAIITAGCDENDASSFPLVTLSSGANQYTVTFDSHDADEEAFPASITASSPGRTVGSLPSEPTKSGMVFAGWSTAPNGGGSVFTADTRVTENITVYPEWSTPGLKFTLINNGTEYSVQKGTADTTGNLVIPGYWTGKKVTAVGAYAFSNCSTMTGVLIPDHVTSIGENAFYACWGLTGVTLPGELTTIGVAAFYGCTGLESIAIPGSVTIIGQGAFAYCTGLTDLTFAQKGSLSVIDDYAFGFCTQLTQTTLPESITYLGHRAFYSCTSLTTLSLNSMVPPESCICIFFNCPMLHTIKVPTASVDTYQATTGWDLYADYIIAQE
jgi:uncharacterized repeat protein (TIGR02543 family)